MKAYTKLTSPQIEALEENGCECKDWTKVSVSDGFDPAYVKNVVFSGTVSLGKFEKDVQFESGLQRHSGIFNATLHNVIVGDNCLIRNVSGSISNYVIGEGVRIEQVSDMTVEDSTSFGNGVCVNVLDETGSTPVFIHDNLSSHEAYAMTQFIDNGPLIDAVNSLIDKYVEKVRSSFGVIGDFSSILDVKFISNVRIGPYTKIHGAARIRNGSINSVKEAPVYIGQNVIMDDFIVCSGSSVSDGAMITRCFVGQACMLGHSYSASDSLFFSNCQGENGEACALFAGPYTVTHHKSTLLIAGMFSFMNAGSGSNQSNHMYKLGPIHHGELQRGAKTTSDSYLLWPARIGAFSLVMGRHVNNPDTTPFPFSYIIEQQDVTYIVPGVNLKSVGTIRDVKKWPKRDKRTDPHKMDKINFNLLSPYTIQQMLTGKAILENLKETSGNRADNYTYQKAVIRNASLFKGIHYYEMALTKFLGNSLITRLENADTSTDESLRKALVPTSKTGKGKWADLSGLIVPVSEIEALNQEVISGEIDDITAIDERLQKMFDNYYEWEWTWAHDVFESYTGISLEEITRKDALDFIGKWKTAVVSLDKLIYEDARKECVNYPKMQETFDQNPFVMEVEDHINRKSALYDKMAAKLSE